MRGMIVVAWAVAAMVLVAGGARAECLQSYDITDGTIAGIPHRHTERFDKAGLGVQFRYFDTSGARNLSYIRFDMGLPRVDDAAAEASLRQVREDIKTVARLNDVTLEGPAVLDPYVTGGVTLTNDIFLGTLGDKVVVEFLGFGHGTNCLHEVRFTAVVSPTAAAVDEARAMYRTVLDDLAPYIADD